MPNNSRLRGSLSGGNTLGGTLNTPSNLNVTLGLRPASVTSYNRLTDRPQINGVTLEGNQTLADLNAIYSDTTANWNANREFIPPAGAIIIYTDHAEIDGMNVPAIKIGDGLAYLIDLPFVSDDIRQVISAHISNTDAHVTNAERQYWNGKVECGVLVQSDGTYCLVFTNS